MNVRLNKKMSFWWYSMAWTCLLASANTRSLTTENYPLATTNPNTITTEFPLSRYERGLEDYEEEQIRLRAEGRGMMMDEDTMSANKALKNDPWQGYYDFLINEGSFKFWAVFQVVTCAILIYSAFAALYYAKYNFIQADYDYSDYFFGRSADSSTSAGQWGGLSSGTFQRILDAISSKKYS